MDISHSAGSFILHCTAHEKNVLEHISVTKKARYRGVSSMKLYLTEYVIVKNKRLFDVFCVLS